MTRLLQEGKFGRFEQSFHDVDEEIRLMAAVGTVSVAADRHATSGVWQRLLSRTIAGQLAAY